MYSALFNIRYWLLSYSCKWESRTSWRHKHGRTDDVNAKQTHSSANVTTIRYEEMKGSGENVVSKIQRNVKCNEEGTGSILFNNSNYSYTPLWYRFQMIWPLNFVIIKNMLQTINTFANVYSHFFNYFWEYPKLSTHLYLYKYSDNCKIINR